MSGLVMLPFVGLALVILAFPLLVLLLLLATWRLRGRVRALEARLQALERDGIPGAPVADMAEAPPSAPVAPVVAQTMALADASPAPEAPGLITEPLPSTPPPPDATGPGPLPEPVVADAPGAQPASWSRLEGRLGGTWLSRVGGLVLVVGIGFFLKHAFEHDWVGPVGRVVIGLVVGAGLLALGERLQRAAYRAPAQGLMGAGIVTLYLSGYAAHASYELIRAVPAFGFMALVTAVGLGTAIRHDARAVAVLANLGGLLTPVLLSTATDRPVALFTYLAILDAGLLVAACWRRWRELALLSFAGTHLLYWRWLDQWYAPEKRAVALVAATVFFALFAAVGPIDALGRAGARDTTARRGRLQILILAAPTLYFLAARRLLTPEHTALLALLCLGLAAGYALAGRGALAAGSGSSPLATLALFHYTVAVAFLTLAGAVHFTERGMAIAWSVEGVALLWGGLRSDASRLRWGALLVLALALGRWLSMLGDGGTRDGRFVLDHPALVPTLAVVAATLVAAGLYRRRQGAGLGGWETWAEPLLVLAALSAVGLFFTDELGANGPLGLPRAHQRVLITMVWTVIAMPILALARHDRTGVLLGAVTLLLAGVGLVAATEDAARWERLAPSLRPAVLNARFCGGLLIAVLYWLYARIVPEFSHVTERSRARLATVARAATWLFLLWHLSAEVWLAPLPGFPAGQAAKLRGAALSILWTLYAFLAMAIGTWRDRAALRIGAMGLFGLAVAKVLLVDLSALDTVYRILSFLVLGAALILASFVYTRFRRRSLADGTP